MYRLENTHWWFLSKKKYIRIILDGWLKDKKKAISILDVGCGSGGMMDVLKDYGKVFGMDHHEAACRFSRRRGSFQVIKGDANKLPFKKSSFHLITLFDVLYHQHILDDEAVLKRVHEMLAPGGFILITDSAFEWLKSRHDLAVMARHRYTLGEIEDKLKRNSFSILKKSYLYFLTFPLVVSIRLLGKITLFFFKPEIHSDLKENHPFPNKVLTALLGWEGKALRFCSFPWGSSLLILGKKT